MNTKHTGGKWVHENGIIWAELGSGQRARIAEIPTLKNHFTAGAALEEDLANAALIVSSPDLLAACEAIVREPQGKTVEDSRRVLSAVIRIARAAIAKARGE